jgi:hypothetical protein
VQGFSSVRRSEVVLAFLRGEIDSARFGDDVKRAIVEAGGIDLVANPDLVSAEENTARENALSIARGWPNTEIFEGFPKEVEWYRGVLAPANLERVRFMEYSYWNELSGGSGRPIDVLPTLRAGKLPKWLADLDTSWCFEFASRLADADRIDGIIVMATPDLSDLVLLEGHARLTALFVGGLQRKLIVNSYLGVSTALKNWSGF